MATVSRSLHLLLKSNMSCVWFVLKINKRTHVSRLAVAALNLINGAHFHVKTAIRFHIHMVPFMLISLLPLLLGSLKMSS